MSEVQHQPKSRVRVWDLPTRLFHWTFAALMIGGSIVGGLAGAGLARRAGERVVRALVVAVGVAAAVSTGIAAFT